MQRSGDLWTLNAAGQQRSETLVNFSLRCKLWTVPNSHVNIVQFTCRLGISDKKKFQSLLLKVLRVLSYKMFCFLTQCIFDVFGGFWVRRVVTSNWPLICSTGSTMSPETYLWEMSAVRGRWSADFKLKVGLSAAIAAKNSPDCAGSWKLKFGCLRPC